MEGHKLEQTKTYVQQEGRSFSGLEARQRLGGGKRRGEVRRDGEGVTTVTLCRGWRSVERRGDAWWGSV
jgi:hypothetical protein